MIAGSISRRYAKALLQLGIEHKNFEALGRELARVVETVQGSRDLRTVLDSPVFPLSQRKAVLGEILARLGVSKTIEHFCQLVLDHNRFPAMPAIGREMQNLVDEQAGRVRALVTSAKLLRDPEALRIKTALERRTGKQVILERKEDAGLLGGIVVQIGDVVYDGSVRNQLARIQEQLLSE